MFYVCLFHFLFIKQEIRLHVTNGNRQSGGFSYPKARFRPFEVLLCNCSRPDINLNEANFIRFCELTNLSLTFPEVVLIIYCLVQPENSCYRSCAPGQGLLCLQLRADESKGSVQWKMIL